MDEFVQHHNYCAECIFLTTHFTRFLRVLKNCPCIHKTYSHFMDALKSQNIPWRRFIFYIFQKNQLKLYFYVRITLTHLLTSVYSIPLYESVEFLRELSSPFVLGCFSKFIQMSCFTGFHFRRTLSAGTASASSLVKNTLCGVRGLVLFPQESPPHVPARQCSMLIIDVALVRRVFYFK